MEGWNEKVDDLADKQIFVYHLTVHQLQCIISRDVDKNERKLSVISKMSNNGFVLFELRDD